MRFLVISPLAQKDMFDIWDFIARDNELAAERVEAALLSQIEKLVRFPGMGHRRADVPIAGYLFVNVYSYAICYNYDDQFLTVLRVVHSARDFPAFFTDQ